MKEKEGFVFMPSFLESLEELPPEDQKEICWAICWYGIHGEAPEGIGPVAKTVMGLIQPIVDNSKNRYQACKENGKKGGNPNFKMGKRNPYYEEDNQKDNQRDNPKDNPKDNQRDNPEDNLNKDKDTDKDSDTDREKEKDTESDSQPRLAADGSPIPGRGTYANVFLSEEEMLLLLKNLPLTWKTYVNQLSDRIYTGAYRGRDHCRAVLDLAKGDILEKYGPKPEAS